MKPLFFTACQRCSINIDNIETKSGYAGILKIGSKLRIIDSQFKYLKNQALEAQRFYENEVSSFQACQCCSINVKN